MQIIRHILTPILIFILFVSGMSPFFQKTLPGSTIGLKEVVLCLKGFVNTSDTPARFSSQFNSLVNTFSIAADIKTVIQKTDDKINASLTDNAYLLPFADDLFCTQDVFNIIKIAQPYKTLYITPLSEPPEIS